MTDDDPKRRRVPPDLRCADDLREVGADDIADVMDIGGFATIDELGQAMTAAGYEQYPAFLETLVIGDAFFDDGDGSMIRVVADGQIQARLPSAPEPPDHDRLPPDEVPG